MKAVIATIVASCLLVAAAPVSEAQSCGNSLQSLINATPSGGTLLVPACAYHEWVLISQPITLDGQHQAVIDGDNTRGQWLSVNTNVSGVTVKNFTMRNAATPQDQGAINTWGNDSNVTISDNVLGPTSNGAPIGTGSSNGVNILRNDIAGGGQLGIISVSDTNLLVQGNHVHGNNTANVDPNYAAGGMKLVTVNGGKVLENEVDHNTGPGIWCDIHCTGMTVANNWVHDQAYNPIFYEISTQADIYGNVVSASGGNLSTNWGAIVVSSSGNVAVHDNVTVDSNHLYALLDNRSDAMSDAGHNVAITYNRVARVVPDASVTPSNELTRWWQYTSSGPLVVGQNGNTDANNTGPISGAAMPNCASEVWIQGHAGPLQGCR